MIQHGKAGIHAIRARVTLYATLDVRKCITGNKSSQRSPQNVLSAFGSQCCDPKEPKLCFPSSCALHELMQGLHCLFCGRYVPRPDVEHGPVIHQASCPRERVEPAKLAEHLLQLRVI